MYRIEQPTLHVGCTSTVIGRRHMFISPTDPHVLRRDGLKAVLSRQKGRGKAEAESSRPMQGRLNSRQGRGEATP